jgi:8-oxo-dGTP pyrophosphatase MutT (NUDIX family)
VVIAMDSFPLDALAAKLAALGKEPGDAIDDGVPRAAVAAIFRERADGAELFFIRRADREGDPWSGHIAFPGGRREAGDATLLATAIRETREEVGIDLDPADLLARLPDVPAFVRSKRGTLVATPFVFALRAETEIVTNQREVHSTLWIPFGSLVRGEGKGTFAFAWEGKTLDLPCIRLGPDRHVLWGMTYRMLETLIEAIAVVGPAPGTGEMVGG